jgi:hypothetical protein
MTGKSFAVAFAALALCVGLYAQRPWAARKYMLHATVTHQAGSATVRADSAQPLFQAVRAVAQQYGWAVDFEDPLFAGTDLTVHPSPRAGVTPYIIVSGGPFQCTYPETPHMWSSRTAERVVLQKVVSDYNDSGNPGQFTVRFLPDGNFDVVGVATRNNAGALVPVKPLLDTIISIPSKPRTAEGTLQVIANALPAKVLVFPPQPDGPVSPNAHPTMVVGGSDVPARDLLMDMVDAHTHGVALGWVLIYQPSPGPEYLLAIRTAERAEYDMFGHRITVPVIKGPR